MHWEKHFVTNAVKNEAPDFVDLTGDGKPELLTAYDKHYGYVSPNPVRNTPWIFHPISTHEEVIHHYTHGMGIGDIDGDGRKDYITGDGWMRQPDIIEFGETGSITRLHSLIGRQILFFVVLLAGVICRLRCQWRRSQRRYHQ